MTYAVKEIFYTLQGEGANAGRPAVFLRFAGCNLWTGREHDRGSAVCQFCDTDFVGIGPEGGSFRDPLQLAATVRSRWPKVPQAGAASEPPDAATTSRAGRHVRPLVVCTGGEPLLQLDEPLIDALHDAGFEVAVETNGTQPVPRGIDHLCVSPKAGAPLVARSGQELKLVYPQREPEAQPERFAELDFEQFFLQPMDGPDVAENSRRAVQYCLEHPWWRLSVQTHKVVGIR
jgi:7-carboxy-7-deazaguanine synthase (Cx14CxxC type)